MKDIRQIVQAELDLIEPAIQAFRWEDRRTYACWLAQTYHMVKHSTRLVALAAAYADLKDSALHNRFVDHAKEERGHELIAVRDIKAMGFELAQMPCLYPPEVMHQTQYYWIQHRGPLTLFGYILFLECLSTRYGKGIYDRTKKAHGEKATVFVKVHAEDDVEHVEKALQQIETFPMAVKESLVENLKLSSSLYRAMLSEIEQVSWGADRQAA